MKYLTKLRSVYDYLLVDVYYNLSRVKQAFLLAVGFVITVFSGLFLIGWILTHAPWILLVAALLFIFGIIWGIAHEMLGS